MLTQTWSKDIHHGPDALLRQVMRDVSNVAERQRQGCSWCRRDLRDGALITLLALNGLRISEALNANIEDLSTERGQRTLAIVRKGGKHVTLPIAPCTGRALDLYIGERTMGPIFLGVAGGRMDRYCADRTVKRLVKRAGIDKRISPLAGQSLQQYLSAQLAAMVATPTIDDMIARIEHRSKGRLSRADAVTAIADERARG